MKKMPHLSEVKYNYADQLNEVSLDLAGNKAYYIYNAGGERVRKVVIKNSGTIVEDRFYVGDYEIYTKKTNGTLNTERETLHIVDDKSKVALIDYDTQNLTTTIRYQYTNHLDSASLELDETGNIITYEEYHPFGTTSYRSGRGEIDVSLKRYKYVHKELDNETGLYYYGMRYYAPWIARFISVDPLQFKYPELTPFQYASNNPSSDIDVDGLESSRAAMKKAAKNVAKSAFNNENSSKYVPYTESANNIQNVLNQRFVTVFNGKQYQKIFDISSVKTQKITYKNSQNIGIKSLSFNIPQYAPYANFSNTGIEKMKNLYQTYFDVKPAKLTPRSPGKCIDCLNWSLNKFYGISRETFINRTFDNVPKLRETVDHTGETLYKLDYIANFKEIISDKNEFGLYDLSVNVGDELLNMVDNNIPAKYFFIISAGSGTHTTAVVLDNTDVDKSIFTFMDQNYNENDEVKDVLNKEELTNKYSGYGYQSTRIYLLKENKND